MKAIIFDFDGLIIDSERCAYQAWEDVYQSHGVHLELAAWSTCIGGFGGEFHSCEHLESLTGYPVDREMVHRTRNLRKRELIALEPLCIGVNNLLERARAAGMKIGLASSSTAPYISEILSRHHILEYFDALATGDEAIHAKPNPEIYQLALTKLHVRPEDAIALEDSPNGFLAASAAGIRCLVIPNSITRQLEFPTQAPILKSLLDVWPEEHAELEHLQKEDK